MEISSAMSSAFSGFQIQQQNLERNVSEVASSEAAGGRDTRTQDRALVEQAEIANSAQASASSLQASGERIGTLIDITV